AFVERFVARPPMRHWLEAVPVSLLTSGTAALEGAALTI
ncbi:MAG: glucokinase, partial [Parvularculaceae bacterium]|nr:glucokinase [Parvularculaceae bacterium]